jgi:hypothetical protein
MVSNPKPERRSWIPFYGAVETSFEFESLDDARKLLGLFYGDSGRECAKLEVGFSAIAYVRTSPA